MCGRFTQELNWEQIRGLYRLPEPPPEGRLQPRYNGAPTQDFAACRLDAAGNRVAAKLRWGLVPSWAPNVGMGARLINARAETVRGKPAYAAAFRSRRCLIPANGWFEWQRTGRGKQPYFLALADGSPLSFAALWERRDGDGEAIESFAVITTAASPALADIHHRQPAIVAPERFDDWLDPASPAPLLLDLARKPLAVPYVRRAVSARVNSVRNDGPDILSPLPRPPMPEKRLF